MLRISLMLLAIILSSITLAGEAEKAIDPANMDAGVKPCVDFYQYANGSWLKANPVPPDKSRWGSFDQLSDRNRDLLRSILEETSARTDWPNGSIEQKIGDFYASGMDDKAIEKAGASPLNPWFAKVAGLAGTEGMPKILAGMHLNGLPGAFAFTVIPDAKESTRNIFVLNQGGLGLPDRDYYIKDDPQSKEIRAKYEAHIRRMFELAGEKPEAVAKAAAIIMDLETRLAKASFTRVENRDPQKTYNKMSLGELAKLGPAFH